MEERREESVRRWCRDREARKAKELEERGWPPKPKAVTKGVCSGAGACAVPPPPEKKSTGKRCRGGKVDSKARQRKKKAMKGKGGARLIKNKRPPVQGGRNDRT